VGSYTVAPTLVLSATTRNNLPGTYVLLWQREGKVVLED